MSGHNKWSNIKHRKLQQNKKKEKIINKITNNILTAIRIYKDRNNYHVKNAINKAVSLNISKEKIEKILLRNNVENKNYETYKSFLYEGYGPGKIAIIIDCIIKNRNGVVSWIRRSFSKYGGNLEKQGSVSHLFNKKYEIHVKISNKLSKNAILKIMNEIKIKKINFYENKSLSLNIDSSKLQLIKKNLEQVNLKINKIKIKLVPLKTINLANEDKVKLLNLIKMIKQNIDVQDVFHNCNIL